MNGPKPDPKALSARLKQLRKSRSWSLDQLSQEMITQFGLERSRQNMHQHETGLRIPSSECVAGYCRVYDLNPEDSRELYTLAGYVVVFAVEEA